MLVLRLLDDKTILDTFVGKYLIVRDYHTEVWLFSEVSTRDTITSLRAKAHRLVMVEG